MSGKREFPLGASYAPFWRGLAAPETEWESDLANMRRLGFSYVSVFAAWHKIEKVEGRFDFTDLDRIDAICSKVGLRISIGVGVHRSFSLYPPRWLERAYKGEGMVDKSHNPAASGLHVLPCFDDPWYLRKAERYLKALARHLSKSENLAQWRVWGEASIHDLCYCPHTAAKFRGWLKKKYRTLGALCEAWRTEGPSDFESFDEIQPPNTASHYGGYVPWLDWQEFLDDNFAATVKWVGDVIKSIDPKRPSLVELALPHCNSSGNGNDFWKMPAGVDQFGLSIYGKASPSKISAEMDMVRSSARFNGAEPWVIEVQGAPRLFRGWGPPNSPSGNRMALWMWQMITHGSKGVFYWTYRARRSDGEGGEFGMTRRDGSIPGRLQEMSEEFQFLQKNAGLFLDAEPKADVAILWSRDAEHLAKIDQVDSDRLSCYVHSVWGARELLVEENIPADFVNPEMIRKGGLKKYKLLIMPFAFCLDKEAAMAVKEFVREGGRVLADFLCAHKDRRGFCYPKIPGAGLDEVFGAAEDEFHAADGWSVVAGAVKFKTYEHCMTLRLKGGKPLARLESGASVAVSNHFGKGQAVYVGTMMFHPQALKCPETRSYILGLIQEAGIMPPVMLELKPGVDGKLLEAVLLESHGRRTLALLNHGGVEAKGTAVVDATSIRDLRGKCSIPCAAKGGKARFKFAIGPERATFYALESD